MCRIGRNSFPDRRHHAQRSISRIQTFCSVHQTGRRIAPLLQKQGFNARCDMCRLPESGSVLCRCSQQFRSGTANRSVQTQRGISPRADPPGSSCNNHVLTGRNALKADGTAGSSSGGKYWNPSSSSALSAAKECICHSIWLKICTAAGPRRK